MAIYTYIGPEELVMLMDDPETRTKVAVVDCRDQDRNDGFIVGSIQAPTVSYTHAMYKRLAQQLFDEGMLYAVFHCALSQVRGPKAARQFAEAQQESGLALPNVYVLRGGWENFYAVFANSRPDLYYV